MEDLPGDVSVDASVVVEHLRSIVGNSSEAYPRSWLPQATFDQLLERSDREILGHRKIAKLLLKLAVWRH